MNAKLFKLIVLLLLGGLLTGACNAIAARTSAEGEPTDIPIVVVDTKIIAEGRLVPYQHVNLSFKGDGQVTKVLVEEGEVIEEGQLIAHLVNKEQLEAAVAEAELERLTAQQAFDALFDIAEVNTALALQAVTEAQDAARDAERYLNYLNAGSRQTDIDSSKADVIVLKDKLDDAREDYKSYENKPEDDLKRATFLSKLADAQQKYNDAVRLLNNLQGSVSDLDMAIAEADVAVADTQLALAEVNYEKVNAGPDPDDLAAAQAGINAAETGLTAAKAALENIELVAPFSGMIVDLELKASEQVSSGQPVVVLADFSQWMVETDDLTEIEVTEIYTGQAVTVTPDALPDLELSGTVESISDLFEEKRGDVTYTARILLDEIHEQLRWGMTVVVTFEE